MFKANHAHLSKYLLVGSRHNHPLVILLTFHTLSPTKATPTYRFKSPIHQNLHSVLDKCPSMKQLKQLHAQIIVNGLLDENLIIGKLVAFCAISKMGDLHYARFVFDRISEPNIFMWNSLIRGYSSSNNPRETFLLYRRMVDTGLSPNDFTFPFVLKACACECALVETLLIHVHSIKFGFGSQVFVQNALIHVYVLCGSIQNARKIFDDIPSRNLVSWNSMIGGYSRFGFCKGAFSLLRSMMDLSLEPDGFTFVSLLSACSQTKNFNLGRLVHLLIVITRAKIDLFVTNALVDMYAKCGHLDSARILFDKMPVKNVVSWTCMVSAYAKQGLLGLARWGFDQMPEKNVVSWNSMISCYVQHGLCREALDLFAEMQTSKVKPDEATLVSVLVAASQIGDLIMGKRIHIYISSNHIQTSITLYNSLINMYAKCGPIDVALDLFSQMPEKNVVSWNVMIRALAIHGCAPDAIDLFTRMQDDGLLPDEITFVGLLCACSHGGLLETGAYYFNAMSLVYGVPQEIEHYACMVDLLGRGGCVEDAIKLIGIMPMKPDIVVWGALLGACRIHGNVEIGKQVLKQLLELEPYSGGLYVLISNIYCEAHRWEEVKKFRKLMKDRGIRKGRALSLIEIDGNVHEFIVEDKRHKISGDIYSTLDQLTDHLRSVGYFFNISRAFLEVEE